VLQVLDRREDRHGGEECDAWEEIPHTKLRSKVDYGYDAPSRDEANTMGPVTRAAPHLSLEDVQGQLRASVDCWTHRQWVVSDTALVEPRPATAMAWPLGVSVPVVPQMISVEKRGGPGALATPGIGGRRPHYVTMAAEQRCLEPF
jgi:hypothetical protein